MELISEIKLASIHLYFSLSLPPSLSLSLSQSLSHSLSLPFMYFCSSSCQHLYLTLSSCLYHSPRFLSLLPPLPTPLPLYRLGIQWNVLYRFKRTLEHRNGGCDSSPTTSVVGFRTLSFLLYHVRQGVQVKNTKKKFLR